MVGIFGAGNTMSRSLTTSSGRYIAYLVTIPGGTRGNLTSILSYEVAPSFTGNVMITCSNELDNRCSKNMTAIGNDEIDPPTDSMNNIITNGRTVTYFWNHPSREMVTGYRVALKIDEIRHQEVTISTANITIPRIENLNYNISVHAVNMCGAESPPLEFEDTSRSAANRVSFLYGILMFQLMTFFITE